MVKFRMVPIDYNGFGASFTPNSYFSRETWKRLYFMVLCIVMGIPEGVPHDI